MAAGQIDQNLFFGNLEGEPVTFDVNYTENPVMYLGLSYGLKPVKGYSSGLIWVCYPPAVLKSRTPVTNTTTETKIMQKKLKRDLTDMPTRSKTSSPGRCCQTSKLVSLTDSNSFRSPNMKPCTEVQGFFLPEKSMLNEHPLCAVLVHQKVHAVGQF